MAFDLPSANAKYSQNNENQARRTTEDAIRDILARLEAAEAAVANGVGVTGPTASFSQVINDLAVTFTDTSVAGDGAITTWAWTFGDGATSTSQNPSHTYASAGVKTVTLTVTDANGKTSAAQATITVSTPSVGPTAAFATSFPVSPLTVKCTDQSTAGTSTIVDWSWTFGDGGVNHGSPNPTHTYAAAGTYTVTLTVVDGNGLSDSVQHQVTATAPAGDTRLRVGMFGYQRLVGKGADGTTTRPFTVAQVNPHTIGMSAFRDMIALADAQDILLIVQVAGGGGNYRDANGFNLSLYESRLDIVAAVSEFGTAIADGRAQIYFADEPNNQASWGNSFSPTLFNAAARACKDRWPTALVHGRLAPTIMQGGWGGFPGLSTYDAIDYGWLQYNGTNRRRRLTFTQALTNETTAGNAINVGVSCSLNLANGGLLADNLAGINPCWDTDNGGPQGSGIVIGVPGVSPYTEGQFVACANKSSVPNTQNILVSPEWILQCITEAAAKSAPPFFLLWTQTGQDAASDADVLNGFLSRPDWVAAIKQGQTVGEARTSFSGMRTPKP